MRRRLLFLVPLLLLNVNCRKKKEVHYFLPEKIRELVMFKDGAYWVYKEQGSGDLDSVWQVNHEDKVHEGGGNKYNYHYHDISVNYSRKPPSSGNSSKKNFTVYSLIYTAPNRPNEDYHSVEMWMKNSQWGQETILGYPFGKKTHSNIRIEDSFFNELWVAGKSYSNVVRVYSFTRRLYQNIYSYYAPHFGLIRTDELTSGKIWELVRYKVD